MTEVKEKSENQRLRKARVSTPAFHRNAAAGVSKSSYEAALRYYEYNQRNNLVVGKEYLSHFQ
jgi:hypothetical protein